MDDRASNLPGWLRRGIARTERERKAAIISRPMRNLFDTLARGEAFEIGGKIMMSMPEIDQRFADQRDLENDDPDQAEHETGSHE